MSSSSACSAARMYFAGIQQNLILALCGAAFAALLTQGSSAQQAVYYDFNTPNGTPGQTSTSCTASSAASGVLFCFNAAPPDPLNPSAPPELGLSYIQDFYPPSIDPNGGAGSTNSALQITANTGSQNSSMWFSIPQDVLDGFDLWYTVKISHTPNDPSNYFTGDGLAFVIQNAVGGKLDSISNCPETGSGLTVNGGGGGCLGYGGIDNSVALEMDTFWNAPYDPEETSQGWMYNDNHIALQSCGFDGSGNPISNSIAHLGGSNCLVSLGGASTLASNPNTSVAPPATASAVTLADGNPHQIVMVYNGPNDTPANYLYVYLDPAFNPGTHTPVAGSLPLFTGPFDITQYIKLNNGAAYIGFTAGTGGDYELHELMGFAFTPHTFGSVNVCPPGQSTPVPCSNTQPVNFNFEAGATISSVQVVTQGTPDLDFTAGSGGTCVGTIPAGGSCTVKVKFAPLAPGLRMGAVKLLDSGGNVLATRMIYGNGQGPAIAFGPGAQTTVNTTASYPLNVPNGATVDAAGNLFIADSGNHRVVKVAANSTVSTVGTGLDYPQGLAVDGAGNLFIADNNLNAVVEVPAGCSSSSCQITNSFGLSAQLGVAVDGAGDLFVSSYNAHEVLEIPAGCSSNACQIVVYSPGGSSNPIGMATDAMGNLFIADFGLQRVVKVPAGCTSSSCQTTVGTGWNRPEAVAVDAAGDVFVADEAPYIVEIPAGCASSACQITVSGLLAYGIAVDGSGNVVIPDRTPGANRVVKINRSQPPSLNFAGTQVGSTSSDSPQSITIQNIGNQPLDAIGPGLQVNGPNFVEVAGSGTPADCSATFSLTAGGMCNLSVSFKPLSTGDPLSSSALFTDNALNAVPATQTVALSGLGLAASYTIGGSVTGLVGSGLVLRDNGGDNLSVSSSGSFNFSGALTPGSQYIVTVFAQPTSPAQNCLVTNGSGLVATANITSVHVECSALVTYALTVTEAGTGTGTLTDNQAQINCSEANGVATGTCSANYPGGTLVTLTANATGNSTFLGWGGACASSGTNPTCILAVNSLVNPTARFDQALPPPPNPLTLQNNYFVTGDYASAGVSPNLRGTGVGGIATGTITIPNSGNQSVPNGADILAAYVYWETLEGTPSPSGSNGTFRGYAITGQKIGNDVSYTDNGLSGMLRVYRADVNAYLPPDPSNSSSGVRLASGSHTVSFPDGGSALPLSEGASLVVIYRVMSPNFPLKSVVIYDGASLSTSPLFQAVQGFYDAVGPTGAAGETTSLFAAGGSWNNSSSSVALPAHSSQYTATLNSGNAYAAVILSTLVNNSDNDGILDAWKVPAPPADPNHGQPGYYDVKTGAWVPLLGAQPGHKDLFVQLDYMCGALLPNGSCDPTKENLFPSPDADGNDPIAMVQKAFAASGVSLHLQIGNAVPEDTCSDAPNQPLCQFPDQPGVIAWKNSLEFSKLWPKNLAACAAGTDCSTRFAYGQKDSYHYLLMGHSLAIPAWNSRFGSLAAVLVAGGVTTITTTDRGTGINFCPSRITISGVLGNPSLNGVYNTTGCSDSKTISVATPGVPDWTYPNNTLPEPVMGLTSGTVTSISGYSDLGGSDSAVTLGLWLTAPNQDMSKRANVIAGTMFHEIGHTLGLSHGGTYYSPGSYVPTFEANCKPNYQSVMNYLFQLDLLGPNQTLAFSNQALNTIIKSGSSATTQLVGSGNSMATFPTSSWYVPFVAGVTTATPATRHCDGTPLNGDSAYRVNAPIAPITPPWADRQDINFDGQPAETMRGFNDITNMDLRQVGATGGQFASLASLLSWGSAAAPLNVGAGGSVSLGNGGTVALGSGGTVTLGSGANATLSSGGTITLGSSGNVTLGSGANFTLGSAGTITPGSDGTVTLGSGGTVSLNIGGTIKLGSGGNVTLGSGGNVTLGSGGTITQNGVSTVVGAGSYSISAGGTIALGSGANVTLSSGGNVTLGSGGTIALGSGGNVTLGSGGNVTLGSGGVIALGSGGNITLGSGGNVTLGSGGTIALGSGGNVTLGSGGNVTLGSGGTVTLGSGGTSLGSGGNVTLGSGGSATLGAGGTVTLGSGGNVTLGSGANATLSSGGTVTLGSGGNITLGSGGTVTLGSGGTITQNGTSTVEGPGTYSVSAGGNVTLGSGGNVTLGSGGNVTLGSGGTITLGSGGNITLGSGGTVTLGSGGNVTLGSGGTIALGSGGNVTLGSGGNVTLGSGGTTTDELTYETANSIVRPPSSPTETKTGTVAAPSVRIDWVAPAFGVVATYTIYRDSGNGPVVIGSVSGVGGNPPATTFLDTNPDTTSPTVIYTIGTTLVVIPVVDPTPRQSLPSVPAVLKNDQTITLNPLPSSVPLPGPQPFNVTATSTSGLLVNFSATGTCSVGSSSLSSGVSSAAITLIGVGNCTITASQPGTDPLPTDTSGTTYYNAATSVSGTFAILAQNSTTQSQTINFAPLPDQVYGNTFTVSTPSSSSGLTVTLTASGPCSISGNSGVLAGVGTCAITASAHAGTVGSNTYSAASVTQTFTIYPAVLQVIANSPSIAFGQSIPALTYSLNGFVKNGSGVLDTVAVLNGTAPSLSTTATSASSPGHYPITVGTGTLAAANYSFLYVNGSLTIQQVSQTITLTVPVSAAYNTSFHVTASGGASGNPVVLTSSGACTNVGSTYTMTGSTGTCMVIANQSGNVTYSAAPQVTKSVNAIGPSVTVSPTSINFGTLYQGSITTKTITVTNNGTAPATINQPFIAIVQGGSTNQFVAVNLCPASLAAGKSCTMTISFVAGAYYTAQTAAFKVMDNAPGSPQLVTLSALVIDPLASFSPTSLSFGTIKHTTNSTLNVTLTNTGKTPLIFSGTGISVKGTNAANFVQTNNCGSSLAAGAKCTIGVKFTPVTTGTFSASLSVVDNAQAGGGTQTVALSGKGN